MSTRIHLVLSEEEKAVLESAARRNGMSLSAWLREAAQEKLGRDRAPLLATREALEAFFRACDAREQGEEPDWDVHREVIEASKTQGLPDP